MPESRAPPEISSMHEAESRALRRAVVVLLVVSLARWGWSRRAAVEPAGSDVLPVLLEESRARAEDEELRARPLEPGERIDPNRAGEAALDRLPGVGPATARAIVAAREEGHIFRSPEDLAVVPGIGPATVERIGPLLDLGAVPSHRGRARARSTPRGAGGGEAGEALDVNRAGAEDLETLPGIGPALAERIVRERSVRPFRSVEDLERVPGIGPATVARLRGFVRVGGAR